MLLYIIGGVFILYLIGIFSSTEKSSNDAFDDWLLYED